MSVVVWLAIKWNLFLLRKSLVILVKKILLEGHFRYAIVLCWHEIRDTEEARWEKGAQDFETEELSSNPDFATYLLYNRVLLLSLAEPPLHRQ